MSMGLSGWNRVSEGRDVGVGGSQRPADLDGGLFLVDSSQVTTFG